MNGLAEPTTAFQNEIPNYEPREESISSLNKPCFRVLVPNPKSVWMEKLKDRFDKLTSLQRGWDGYSGTPVSFSCAQFAANLIERLCVDNIPPPQLVPGSDGTLQLEWHINQFDLEVDVLGPYDVVAIRYDHVTRQEEEIEIRADFTELKTWIYALGQAREQQHGRA